MSAQITVHVAGSERAVDAGTTYGDLVGEDRSVLVARVGGELRDLHLPAADGDVIEPVTAAEQDGLDVLRHSAAHVLAQAVQQLKPEAKLGIGPPVRDGFYYDFDVETPFTPEDLKALEKTMQRIVNEGQTFHRREVSATPTPPSSWPTSRTRSSSSGSRAGRRTTPPKGPPSRSGARS